MWSIWCCFNGIYKKAKNFTTYIWHFFFLIVVQICLPFFRYAWLKFLFKLKICNLNTTHTSVQSFRLQGHIKRSKIKDDDVIVVNYQISPSSIEDLNINLCKADELIFILLFEKVSCINSNITICNIVKNNLYWNTHSKF